MGTIKQNRANNILTSGKLDATDGLNNNVPATNIANASLSNITSYPPSAGAGVSSVASDPPSPNGGQIWYNTTSGALKQYSFLGSWVSGGNANTARETAGSFGTQTSNIVASGNPNPKTNVESYDGSTWTEVADLNVSRGSNSGAGVSNTSGLIFSGDAITAYVGNTETWNGSSWTEVNDLNTGGFAGGGAGTQTAALMVQRYTPAGITNVVESWDGTNWTEVGEMNTARYILSSTTGSNTAAIVSGGNPSPASPSVELWNGTSWTETTELNTPRWKSASSGISTLSLTYGGLTPSTTVNTEAWNGSTWTELNNLSIARGGLTGSGAGTQNSALASFGNLEPGLQVATEEWTQGLTVQTITAS